MMTQQLVLRIRHPEHGIADIPVDPSEKYVIGRSHADVVLAHENGCSRRHATLAFTGGGWQINDEMSTNGTVVGGKKVNFALLGPGVVAKIGETELEVVPMGMPEPGVAPAVGTAMEGPPVPPRGAPAAPAPRQPAPAKAPDPEAVAARKRKRIEEASKDRSNAPMLVVAAVIALVALGGLFIVAQSVSKGSGSGDTTADGGSTSRSSPVQLGAAPELESELTRALAIQDPVERLEALGSYRQRFGSAVAGSELLDRLRSAERETTRLVDARIDQEGERLLDRVALAKSEGHFREAHDSITGYLEQYEAQGRVWRRRAEHLGVGDRVREARTALVAENEQYLGYRAAVAENFVLAGEHERGVAVYEQLIETAILSDVERELFRGRISQIRMVAEREAELAANPRPRPGVDDPTEEPPPSLEDVLREREDVVELPDQNPLLPDGEASEVALIQRLYGRIGEGIRGGRLENTRWMIGNRATEVTGADARGVQVVESELGAFELVRWETIPVPAIDDLTKRMELRDGDAVLALSLLAFQRDEVADASRLLVDLYRMDNSLKHGIDVLIATKRRIGLPRGGFVIFEDRFLTPAEKEATILTRQIAALVQTFERGLGSRADRRQREASAEAFEELKGLGDDAVRAVVAVLGDLRQRMLGDAERATGLTGDTSRLADLRRELDRRREHALELIFDLERWPYPRRDDHDQVAREVMNDRVAAVREVWENPAAIEGYTNPQFEALVEKITELNARLLEIDPQQQYHRSSNETDMEYLSTVANRALNIQNYGATEGQRALINYNRRVMEENAAKREEFAGDATAPSAEAWEQLRITNEYRIMMGRRAMKMSFKLYWGAYHHSQWCVQHNNNQITHDAPNGPRGYSPGDRMQHEGYHGPGGENIHINSAGPTAFSSHMAWLHSSGHHRNILNPRWVVMGNGRFGQIWTQKFGGLDEGEGNYVSRGGE